MRKLKTLLLFESENLIIDKSVIRKKYENIIDGFKMQNNEFWRDYWRFIDVLNSRVISIAEHVFILNKIQVEETVSAFNTIFGIDIHVNGVNVSNQSGTLSADYFLDLKSIPRILYSTYQF